MHTKKKVYLAGPITGLSYGEARNGWREAFRDIVARDWPHIETYSPMRAKEFLRDSQCLPGSPGALANIEHALARPYGILTRDYNDVQTCDAMVACFLGAKVASIGTCWEFGAAYANRKPVITVMEPSGNIHDHIFISATSGYIVPTLEEAAHILGSLLTPGI